MKTNANDLHIITNFIITSANFLVKLNANDLHICRAGAIIFTATKWQRRLPQVNEGANMIELKHIEFAYESGSELLRDINMQVNDGEYIAIVGENGSGKSTLIKLLLGLLEPSKGELKNTFGRIGYVPQRFETLNSQFPITVYEVMEYYRRVLKVADKQAVRRCLEQMHVYDLRDRLIGTLSGGQCQKVLIARALLGNPQLLIFDEPSTGIDVKSQQELYKFMQELHEQGITIITVEHNLKFAARNADKMYHVMNGHGHFCNPQEYVQEYMQDNVGGAE